MKITCIEWMIITAIVAVIAAIAIPAIAAKTEAGRKPSVEQKIDVGWGMSAKIIVLPTGERVLFITGCEGLATCCLLPPLPEPKVEKGSTP